MKARKKSNTYSVNTRLEYVVDNKPILIATSHVDVKYKWVNKEPTDEIEGYTYHFVQDGVNPFSVKVAEKLDKIPDYLTEVELENFEAIEFQGKVFFRASRIKVTK